MEFNQYRAYSPGDDLRLIDWKMYGRTDKYFIRQALIETEHQFVCQLDSSQSMDYAEDGVSKILLGKILSACMTLIAAHQGDKFGWQSTNIQFPMGTGMRHWHQGLEGLFVLSSQEGSVTYEHSRTNTIYAWITDLYYSLDELEEILKNIKNHTTELIVFHVLGEKEENLAFDSGSTFIDLETGKKIEVDAPQYRKQYKERMQKHLASCQNLFYRYGIHYIKAPMQKPADQIMKIFLDKYNYLIAA